MASKRMLFTDLKIGQVFMSVSGEFVKTGEYTAKVARHDGLGPVGAWVAGTVPVLMIIGLALSASALARLAVGG